MNTVATKSIAAFSINLSDWYYEGQVVNVTDGKLGKINNALIMSINEIGHTFVVNAGGKSYSLSMLKIKDIESVNRRRIAV